MNPLVAWVKAREDLRLRKESGVPPRWTEDPIFANYRFCNVRREDDKVTRWVFNNWLFPNKYDADVWFAMVIARHLNRPDTLEELGYPVPWDPKRFLEVMKRRKTAGETSYSAAYMIRADAASPGEDKSDYLCRKVFASLWEKRDWLRPKVGDTLDGFHQRLMLYYGVGSFLGAQIIADTKHVEPLKSASDWWTFAASGPGSQRGLNRYLGRPVNSPWKEQDWRSELARLQAAITPELEALGLPKLDGQNVNNCCCEFDKYERARLGEGRPKQRYVAKMPQLLS